MSTKPNQEFKVRLSRTSSAQAVLKKERKKSVLKVDDIIDDDRSTDTVTGRLPTEAAYVIMKRVTAEVGHPLNPAGISTYNKLQSLKTSPAVELLQQKTWREFFSKKTAAHVSMAGSVKATNAESEMAFLNGTGATDEIHKRQSEMKQHLQQMFDRLVARVEQLWSELKIPNADRVFYRKSLCKGPPQSVEQCREIAAYIAALKVHHEATVNVILAIQTREMAIAKCFDVLAALQRKFSRTNQRETTLGSTVPTLRSSFSAQLNFHGAAAASGRQEPDGGGGGSSFWKEELIVALDDVRSCSLEVIKRVQTWRRNLWRPHPFVYMGVNYVAKMKDDLSILESDIYTKLLALVPLRFSDLQCIVFYSNTGAAKASFADTHASQGHQPVSNGGSPARPPAHPISFSFDFSHMQQQHQAGRSSSINSQSGEIYIQQLLQEFLHKVNPKELQLAATIVLEEDMLQNALAIEHASLLSKGVFIPTLHTKGGQSAAERVVARPTSSHNSSFHHHQQNENRDNGFAPEASHQREREQHAPFVQHEQVDGQQPRSRDEEAVDWTPDFAT